MACHLIYRPPKHPTYPNHPTPVGNLLNMKNMKRTVPRLLDYAALAQLHRPTDPAALQAEVRRLASQQRLSATDISVALRVSLPQVREMLAATGTEAAQMHAERWKL